MNALIDVEDGKSEKQEWIEGETDHSACIHPRRNGRRRRIIDIAVRHVQDSIVVKLTRNEILRKSSQVKSINIFSTQTQTHSHHMTK